MVSEEEIVVPLWAVITSFASWTILLAGVLIWLNSKFSELLPMSDYEIRHRRLESRVRSLELWAATKGFFTPAKDDE
jgi:hypothetical protein